jgi:tetratricopeptide (TPR) repeat protein
MPTRQTAADEFPDENEGQEREPPSGVAIADLRAGGGERLRANAFAEAIEPRAPALIAEPTDAATQFNLGIALPGAGDHTRALKCFPSVQRLRPDEAAPFLHAARSYLNLDKAAEALLAASQACLRRRFPHVRSASARHPEGPR